MAGLRAFLSRVGSLLRRRRLDAALDEELRAHLAMQEDDYVRAGMSPDEARRQARLRLGGIEQTKEAVRDARATWIDSVWQDLRYGARSFRRDPGLSAVAVLTLALAIGANTAIFTVVSAVLLRPLPYHDPDRLIRIYEANLRQGHEQFDISAGNYLDWRRQSRGFEAIGIYDECRWLLTNSGEPVYLNGATVSPNLMDLLGVQPVAGRSFTQHAEGEFPFPPDVLISHGLWTRLFGADPHIVGRPLVFDRRPLTIVGVMPPGFRFPEKADFWVPWETFPGAMGLLRRSERYRQAIGRLKAGVTLEQAGAEMRTIARRLELAYPQVNAGWTVRLIPLQETLVGQVRRALLLLLGAVACLLLIGCVNVANLMLARGSTRHHETAVRAALGASRLRLVRHALSEGLVLAVAGGAAGLVLAVSLVGVLRRVAPPGIPRLDEVSVDWRVLAFTLLVALATGIAVGTIPALRWSAAGLSQALNERFHPAGAARLSSQRLLLASEVALALVLLVGAGLLVRSFVALRLVDPGFDATHVTMADVTIMPSSLPDRRSWYMVTGLYNGLVDRLEHLPGIQSAGGISDVPLSQSGATNGPNGLVMSFVSTVDPKGARREGPPLARWPVTSHVVTRGYFRTMGIKLVSGRTFTAFDAFTQGGLTSPSENNDAGVVVINEALARMIWPGQDPIGRWLWFDFDFTTSARAVVGVVRDVRFAALDVENRPEAYMPQDQRPTLNLAIVVRSALDGQALAPMLRREIRAFRHGLVVHDVKTMDEVVAGSVSRPRFTMLLVALFAVGGVTLAAIGLYGVMAYFVTRRTPELAIRMALGADHRSVVAMVVLEGMRTVAIGGIVGLALALAGGRLMSHLLFGVGWHDFVTFAAVSALLAAVSLLACYLPARRAARVDPMAALRCE